eukprot:evm.model.scf_1961.1 EVM.evm.TU.scf_1961.1   scf_1961:5384-9815(-)
MVELVRNEGWQRLFAGVHPALIGAGLSQGLYFYFYSALRDLALAPPLSKDTGNRKLLDTATTRPASLSVSSSMLVASAAGCINVILTNPIWVLVTRMQADPSRAGQRTTLADAFRQACTEEGYQWTIKGLAPSLVMVCNPTIQYMIYEWLLGELRNWKALSKKGGSIKPSALEVFVVASLAKLGATVCTYPLLLVKNRLQASKAGGLRYEGTFDAIYNTFEEEGVFGFYRGMGAKMLQSVFSAALMLVIKEQLTEGVRWLLRGESQKLRK